MFDSKAVKKDLNLNFIKQAYYKLVLKLTDTCINAVIGLKISLWYPHSP